MVLYQYVQYSIIVNSASLNKIFSFLLFFVFVCSIVYLFVLFCCCFVCLFVSLLFDTSDILNEDPLYACRCMFTSVAE